MESAHPPVMKVSSANAMRCWGGMRKSQPAQPQMGAEGQPTEGGQRGGAA